jgi:hypothetical protein
LIRHSLATGARMSGVNRAAAMLAINPNRIGKKVGYFLGHL